MFERFTDRARHVLVLAQEEARGLNHNFIGTEHILLGLIHEGQGVGAKALEVLGVTVDAARARVMETIGPGESTPTGSPPFTSRAKKVLELSLREAMQLGHNYIGTEHMLLGLVREGEGVAATVLVELGADLERVRQQVIELLAGYQGATAAESGTGSTQPVASGTMKRIVTPLGDPPQCPQCRAGLAEQAVYRSMMIPADMGDEEPRAFVVVYCRACGRALGLRAGFGLQT